MLDLPPNEYLELREGRYCLAGTRIGLDIVIHAFRRGKTPEAILQAYPSIGSLGKVYGVIAFMLENPHAIECYLREQEALWSKFREDHPLPDDIRENYRRTQNELVRRTT